VSVSESGRFFDARDGSTKERTFSVRFHTKPRHISLTTTNSWIVWRRAAVSLTLSVPNIHAFPGRIFSLMNAKWRQDWNCTSVCFNFKVENANFNFECCEFYEYVLSDKKLCLSLPAVTATCRKTILSI